jgi:hypothetical protein
MRGVMHVRSWSPLRWLVGLGWRDRTGMGFVGVDDV